MYTILVFTNFKKNIKKYVFPFNNYKSSTIIAKYLLFFCWCILKWYGLSTYKIFVFLITFFSGKPILMIFPANTLQIDNKMATAQLITN